MHSAYFSDYAPPGGQPLRWHDDLARQQEIYEELLASQELERARPARTATPKSRPLSAREITRDLAGWSPPRAGTPRIK